MIVFEQLYQKYKQDVFRYLLSLTHDKSVAEDLLSECFIIAMRKLPLFRGESTVKTWLFGIARNCWLQYLRKDHPTIPYGEIAMKAVVEDISDSSYTKEIAERIVSLIKEKDERTQIIVKMRIDGYSYREIAERLQVSEGSVRVIYHRTKKQLRDQLSREGFDLVAY